jgi:hypothetical protein
MLEKVLVDTDHAYIYCDSRSDCSVPEVIDSVLVCVSRTYNESLSAKFNC